MRMLSILSYLIVMIVAATSLSSMPAHAASVDSPPSRDALRGTDLSIESAAQMAEFLALSVGDDERAACLNRYYFGSPLFPRDTANAIWKYPDHSAVSVLIFFAHRSCAAQEVSGPTDPNYWTAAPPKTKNPVQPDPGNLEMMVRGALWSAASKANIDEEVNAKNCLLALYDAADTYVDAVALIRANPARTVQHIAYKLVQEACRYPSGGTGWTDVPFKPFEHLTAAAVERIVAAQELATCEEKYAEADRPTCVATFRRLRALDIASSLALTSIDRELTDLERQREEMRRNAWRLPDGRLIFEDRDGRWHFENGDFVADDLAATRVPPP